MSKSMRNNPVGPNVPMPQKGALEKLNSPVAREHKPHVSAENKLGNYTTPAPPKGNLGGRHQPG